ncbi:hypothetical protein, partial [Acinetobacter baumannii]|uniref:hypothetical protein n=1 Tax=Acinetobacter baumannii TaxID=470 RepID=UPI001BB46BF8
MCGIAVVVELGVVVGTGLLGLLCRVRLLLLLLLSSSSSFVTSAVCVVLMVFVSRPDAVQLRLAQRCPMPLLKSGGVETERVGTGQLGMKQLSAA